MNNAARVWCGVAVAGRAALLLGADGQAQGRGNQAPAAPPPTARASAPFDLAGNWVSFITEDWRWRMVTPAKGDYASVPINPAAKKAADAWDPAKDEAAGEQCKAYGAAGLMRLPTRLRISWMDDSTLKVETDAGMQTRLLNFGARRSGPGKPSRQGDSVASWELAPVPGGAAAAAQPAAGPRFGNLKVVTTNMLPGYLRKNGIPYSANAVLTEYWQTHRGPRGDEWLVITTVVDDPMYLFEQPYVTSPNFKREPDGSKWDPQPCSAR
jgi:hypothetical protein